MIDQKNVERMGMSLSKNHPEKKSDDNTRSAHNALTVNKNSCHICGKDDHITVTTRKGNVIVPYYVCEKFVKLSAAEEIKNSNFKKFVHHLFISWVQKRSQMPLHQFQLSLSRDTITWQNSCFTL